MYPRVLGMWSMGHSCQHTLPTDGPPLPTAEHEAPEVHPGVSKEGGQPGEPAQLNLTERQWAQASPIPSLCAYDFCLERVAQVQS